MADKNPTTEKTPSFQVAEPNRRNRFICYVEGIPAYLIKAVRNRKYDSATKNIHLDLELYDPIAPDGFQCVLDLLKNDEFQSLSKIIVNNLSATGHEIPQFEYTSCKILGYTISDLDWADDSYQTVTVHFQCEGMEYVKPTNSK